MKRRHRELPDDQGFWFFGIHIERKTDILAFAAFLIALSGVFLQVSSFFRGPVVRIFSPPQILIRKADPFPSGRVPVRFAALVAYVNDGDAGYNATIRRELLHYELESQTYTQEWQEFIASDLAADGKLQMNPKGVAQPMVLNAGSSMSHETYFTPLAGCGKTRSFPLVQIW